MESHTLTTRLSPPSIVVALAAHRLRSLNIDLDPEGLSYLQHLLDDTLSGLEVLKLTTRSKNIQLHLTILPSHGTSWTTSMNGCFDGTFVYTGTPFFVPNLEKLCVSCFAYLRPLILPRLRILSIALVHPSWSGKNILSTITTPSLRNELCRVA
ncbi:hypothetical protein AX15_004625 [Amanita polypyramis BW_CC]|nr:hypothetical protein AX15_004625 [Amanita polypyramis BW_CC]